MKDLIPIIRSSRTGFVKQAFALLGVLAITATPGIVHAGKKPSPPPVEYPYNIRQLALPTEANSISAANLNEAGVVVGDADFPNYEWQACFWRSDGTVEMLPLLENALVRRSTAGSITDSGTVICGNSVPDVSNEIPYYERIRATYWYWDTVRGDYVAQDWNDFPLPPEHSNLHLVSSTITPSGQFVRLAAQDKQTGDRATVIAEITSYLPNGQIGELTFIDFLLGLSGDDMSFNESDGVLRVVGITDTAGTSPVLSYLWRHDGITGQTDLVFSDEAFSNVLGRVNRLGQVVKYKTLGSYEGTSFFWQDEGDLWDTGRAVDLGAYDIGGTETRGMDLDDRGQIVGWSYKHGSGRRTEARAFLFVPAEPPLTLEPLMLDLNTVAPVGKTVLSAATRINNAGQILVSGSTGNAGGWYVLEPNPTN